MKTIIITLLLSIPCLAEVNMKDASYYHTWQDFNSQGFHLERTYRSRSLYKGIFGFGWCTNFEKKINPENLTLNECGIDLGKSTQITFNGDVFLNATQDKTLEVFSLTGQLIELRRDGHVLAIEYNSRSQILRLRIDQRVFLVFEYYLDSSLVKQITEPLTKYPAQAAYHYLYNGSDLTEARRLDQFSPIEYEYDFLHNLVAIHNENKTTDLITYDDNRDWVIHIRDKNNCTEHYNYIQSASHPGLEYASSVEKKCDDKIVYQANYQFIHKMKSDGTTYLDKVKISFGKSTTEITYHPVFGNPTQIAQSRGGHP